METIVLVVHLIIAVVLIAVVLLQRSEGGALGIGGGGGGLVSQRGAATALSKVTWALAIGFLCTSIILTVLSGTTTNRSVFGSDPASLEDGAIPLPELPLPNLPTGGNGEIPLPAAPTGN